jgi:hypothetical protein
MKKRPLSDYTLFAEAWIFLALGRLMLVFIPFKKIAKFLGKPMHESPAATLKDPFITGKLSMAIARAGKYSPWRTKCFEQAIAAKIMLQLRGIGSTVYFGVYKTTTAMQAHAWLTCNATIVTGGPDVSKFTVISWFGS